MSIMCGVPDCVSVCARLIFFCRHKTETDYFTNDCVYRHFVHLVAAEACCCYCVLYKMVFTPSLAAYTAIPKFENLRSPGCKANTLTHTHLCWMNAASDECDWVLCVNVVDKQSPLNIRNVVFIGGSGDRVPMNLKIHRIHINSLVSPISYPSSSD